MTVLAEPMIPLRLRPASERRLGVVSITLPSRHRPEMLTRSVDSLRDTAARPDLLEFLVAYDPDDPHTAETARGLGFDVIWQSPIRYGYSRSAYYYAALIERCTGEWTLPTWGDDGIMQTRGWDDLLRGCPPGTVVWADGNIAGMSCYPAVHVAAFEALGRIPPLPALDHWYMDAGRWGGVMQYPLKATNTDPEQQGSFYVHQNRFDLTGQNGDKVYFEGRDGYRVSEFLSEPYTTWRREDAETLRHLAERLHGS